MALPLIFLKNEDGTWSAKWLHLYLKGTPNFNRVELNRVHASVLTRSILDRQYLQLQYLVELMRQNARDFSWHGEETSHLERPVTFLGLEAPEGLPEGSEIYTLSTFHALIPS